MAEHLLLAIQQQQSACSLPHPVALQHTLLQAAWTSETSWQAVVTVRDLQEDNRQSVSAVWHLHWLCAIDACSTCLCCCFRM
jgi:hypothetical protein